MSGVNTGNYWNSAEDYALKERFSYGRSLREMADLHGRTPLAIEWRLAKYAADEICENRSVSLSDVADKYGVPHGEILTWLTRSTSSVKH